MSKSTPPKDIRPDASQIRRWEELGEWLQTQRNRKELSQREVSVVLDVDKQTVSNWENGKQGMSADAFLSLVILYEAEEYVDELFAEWNRLTQLAANAKAGGGR